VVEERHQRLHPALTASRRNICWDLEREHIDVSAERAGSTGSELVMRMDSSGNDAANPTSALIGTIDHEPYGGAVNTG
jgi:hypothetical protein